MKCPKCQFDNPTESRFCSKCGTQMIGLEGIGFSHTETLKTPLKELTTGSTFAHRYQVIEELGRGGMGKVYKALDTKIKENVAIKLVKPEVALDSQTIERFQNELKFARKISHKNVCRMYDLNEDEGSLFITMEYVPGEDLKNLIRKVGQFSVGKAVSVARQVCEGLAEAHQHGVVHRDLKPQNIMIDNEGNVRIMDFGIARSLKAKGITDERVMIGTPEYMSPEQVEGIEADARADIYALGVILYEMLTGRVPFEGDTALSVALKHKTELPKDPREWNAQIPDDLSRLILRCLEKDKAQRYQKAEEILADLNRIEAGVTPVSGVYRPTTIAAPRKRRWPVVAAGAVIVLMIIAISIIFILRTTRLDVNPRRVVVAPFENKTGDPSLDSLGNIAADWIAQGLSQAGEIEVIPGMAAQESVQIVEKETGKIRGIKQLQALAKETGAGTVVWGAYYLQGEDLQFQGNITDIQKGKLIFASPSIAGNKDKPMEVVKALQQRLMGTAAAYFDVDMGGPIASLKPPTFDAYQEHLRGMELFGKDYAQANEHFNKALELDPTFLMPKAILAVGYCNQGNFDKANEIFQELNKNRLQLDPATRGMVDAMMAWMRGQHEESLRYQYQIEKLVPNLWMWPYNIALGEVALNRPQRAIDKLSKIDIKKINVTRFYAGSWFFGLLANSYHMIGDYKKELEVARLGQKYFPDRMSLLGNEVQALAALGKIDQVKEAIERSLTMTSGSPGSVMTIASLELRAHGHLEEARKIAEQALEWYKSRPPEKAATEANRSALAFAFYFAERWQDALSLFENLASEYTENINYKGNVGCTAARLGDREKALKISEELRALNKPYLFGEHTYTRACIASILGEKEQAVTLLRESFAQGAEYGVYLHREIDFESLRDYPPFQSLLRPKK